MKKCTECGEDVTGLKFCPQCGAKATPTGPDAATTATVEVATPPASTIAARSPFATVPPQQFLASALGELLVYVGTWVLALVITLLLLIELSVGGAQGLDWGWLAFAPGHLIGLSLAGVFSASASILGASATVYVLILPLILTASVIVGTVLVARRRERLVPSPTRGTRWLLSLTSGLVLAVASIIVAAIFPLTEQLGGGQGAIASLLTVPISLSSVSISLFFGALVVGTLSSFLGRSAVAARSKSVSLEGVGQLRGNVRATLPAVGLYLVLASVLIAVTIIIAVVVLGDGAALLSALLWLPTLVANGLALINFGAITLSGSASSLLQASGLPTTIWMPTTFPAWLTLIVVVVNLLLIVLIGAVIHLRRTGRSSTVGERWGTTVISFALLGAVLSFIGGAAVWTHLNTSSLGSLLDGALSADSSTSGLSGLGATGSSAADAYASMTFFAGPAAWTFLVFAILGALIELSAVYVAPFVLPLVPAAAYARTSRVLSRVRVPIAASTGGASPQPEPMTPERKRRTRLILGGVGGAVALIVLIVIAGSILTSTAFAPQNQVRAYLDSLVAKNASQAVVIGGLNGSGSKSLLTDAVLKATPEEISGYSILDSSASGDSATVNAKIAQGHSSSLVTYSLHKDGSTWLFFPNWKLDRVALPQLTVEVSPSISSLSINGVTVPVSSAQAAAGTVALPAFPGKYTVALGGDTQWVSATAKSAVIGSSEQASSNPISLAIKPTSAFRATVSQQVQTFLAGCAAQQTLSPTDCPFEEYSFGTDSAIVWKIVSQPKLTISANDDGSWGVSTDEPGSATVNYNDDFFGVTAESDSDDIYLTGVVKIVGGKPVFSYQSGY